jgi:hypothetical protein
MLQLQSALTSLKVKDAARRRFRVLEANASLRQLSEERLGEASPVGLADWLLVCDRGRWQGVIDDRALRDLPVQRWDTDRVGDHLDPLNSLPGISAEAPLWQAVQELEERNCSRLLVFSPAGLPCGTLERPELGEAVLTKLGVKLPEPLLQAARRQSSYPLGLALPQVVRAMVASGELSATSTR